MKELNMSPELQRIHDQVEAEMELKNRAGRAVMYEKLRYVFVKLRVANSKLSIQLMKLLAEYEELNVSQIGGMTGWAQPVVSQTLAKLRATKWVLAERDGKQIYYRLNTEQITRTNEVLQKYKITTIK